MQAAACMACHDPHSRNRHQLFRSSSRVAFTALVDSSGAIGKAAWTLVAG
jgi:hypothetical protein